MFFSRKIAVTFINSQTNQVLARMSVAPEQLPDSFLLDTTLHLDGEDWSVDSAEPPTRAQYAKTRKLLLRVSRVQLTTIDPRELLFTLPTISDALPADDQPADGTELLVMVDDWRQLEFVHQMHLHQVAAEFADIQRVCMERRSGIGYTECHVRKRITSPLPNLHASPFPEPSRQKLRLHGHDHRVKGGFAVPLSGHWLLYGTHDGERVDTLGLVRGNEPLSPTHQDALACFVAEHALVLVDWCRHTSVDPNTQSLRAILG